MVGWIDPSSGDTLLDHLLFPPLGLEDDDDISSYLLYPPGFDNPTDRHQPWLLDAGSAMLPINSKDPAAPARPPTSGGDDDDLGLLESIVLATDEGMTGEGSGSVELGLSEELQEKVRLAGDSDVAGGVHVDPDAFDGRGRGDGFDGCMVPSDNGEMGDGCLVDASVKMDEDGGEGNVPESGGTESHSGTSESESDDDSSSSSRGEESSEEGGEDDDEDDNDGDKDKDDGGKWKRIDEDVELEEGEIRDLDPEEIVLSSDDEEEMGTKGGPMRSENELNFLPPVLPVHALLEPHHRTLPVGVISSVIGTRVIVEGSVQHNPLSDGSILWITQTRSPLGLVDEIFGPIRNPFYVVRYNSEKEVPPGISEGTAVSLVAEFAVHILNQTDLYKKGYDATGENDEEVSDEEFSDDEKEAEYKRSLRQAKRGTNNGKHGNQEFMDKKRVQFDKKTDQSNFGGSSRKDVRPPVPCTSPTSSQRPTPVPMQLQAPPVSGHLGCSNNAGSFAAGHACGSGLPAAPQIPHATQPGGFLGVPQQNLLLQQLNVLWANGMLPQQPNMGLSGICPMNGMQIQVFPCFSSGVVPFQHQFNLNLGMPPNVPWLCGSSNPSMGTMGLGPLGQGGVFGQPPSGCTNIGEQGLSGGQHCHGQLQPAVAQVNLQAAMQFNPGTSSVRGRRPCGRGGRYSFGRDGRPRSG